MAQLAGADEIESFRIELAEIGRSIRSSFRSHASSFRSATTVNAGDNDVVSDGEHDLQWAAVERLPTFERITSALFDDYDGTSAKGDGKGTRVVDVTKLGAQERRVFIEKLIKHIENDNLQLLQKIRRRIDQVGVKLPTVAVRYKNLCVEAECKVVHGKPLPNLWNTLKSLVLGITELTGSKTREAKISIIKDVSGIIKLGRMTLLLGPPGCGKTTLLMALSGKLSHSLKGSLRGKHLIFLRVVKVYEAEPIMMEVSRREEQAGIVPDPDVDAYMKATSVKGLKNTLQTDYILKILGLDICADTLVGDPIRRGISGGQKKRLTTGEMIVITDATALILLLQPAPETFDLFDDVLLMAEGKIVFHGPRAEILKFFEECGFKCPESKGVADFLQEVISRKDQAQYWDRAEQPYGYISVDLFIKKLEDGHLERF